MAGLCLAATAAGLLFAVPGSARGDAAGLVYELDYEATCCGA